MMIPSPVRRAVMAALSLLSLSWCWLIPPPPAAAHATAANPSTASAAQESSGKPGGPRTIADYFMLIPERYMRLSQEERRAVLRRLETRAEEGVNQIDTANGFMTFTGAGRSTTHTVALFRRPDGSPLIAVTHYGLRVDERRPFARPTEIAELYFLSHDGARWRDVTRSTLPLPFNRQHRYLLPRRGTTVGVYSEGDHKEYDLVWSRGRFTVRRPPPADRIRP